MPSSQMPAPLPTPPAAIGRRQLAPGETLFFQGDRAFAVFAVRHGRIRLLRHLADGSTVALYVAHDGETFAEAALFSDVYHCDAIADVASEIDIHPKEALSQALDDDRLAAKTFMAHLARQVISLRARLEIRNIRLAEERVIHFLQLAVDDHDLSVTFLRPLKDIASDIGLTHEAFYRTLSKLERSGTITRHKRTLTLVERA